MKKHIIIPLFLLFFVQLSAEPKPTDSSNSLERWAKFYSEIYDIELTKPKHMIDRWQWTDHILWFDWNNITSRDGIIFMFESEDRNFLLTCSHDELYNRQSASNTSLQADTSGRYQCSISENYPRAYAAHELEASYGYIKGHKRVSYKVLTLEDFNTYVTVYSGKKVRRWFNADSVYTYPLPAVDVFYRVDFETLCLLYGGNYFQKRSCRNVVETLFYQRGQAKRTEIPSYAPENDLVQERRLAIRSRKTRPVLA